VSAPGKAVAIQPTRFKLFVNAMAAKALRLGVPPMVLARPDEVIE
jgi:hypothetical protein